MRFPFTSSFFTVFVRFLYTLIIVCVAPVMYWMLWQRAKPNAKQRLQERFGKLGAMQAVSADQETWLIHCVSVGEVEAAAPLITQLLERYPDNRLVVSTSTDTGAQRVMDIFAERVQHYFLPFDLPWAMAKFLDALTPKQIIITEVELWPNMLQQCAKRSIPVSVINARMTDSSAKKYQKLSALIQPMLTQLHCVCAQGQRDYDNYLMLGMAAEKLYLTHNMKFDITGAEQLKQQGENWAALLLDGNCRSRSIIVAGSTHPTEEQAILAAFERLLVDFPDALLLLVPRHPQRFDEVAALLDDTALTWQKSADQNRIEVATKVCLVNQMGVLKSLYSLASVAFIGGSIADKGGHNALEAALFGVPVMMGPHRYNNPVICQTLADAGALAAVNDADDIYQHCQRWLADDTLRKQHGQAGLAVIQQNGGAISNTLSRLGL